MFKNGDMGSLVPIHGVDAHDGSWEHRAFVPAPLPDEAPVLSGAAYMAVGNARAALASLDSTARSLPNPQLLRYPTLRREAQSTSALEGTYAPLESVLKADAEKPRTSEMTEILNYMRMADAGFTAASHGRAISLSFLDSLQGQLMQGTPLQGESGMVRETQVVIGRRAEAPPGALLQRLAAVRGRLSLCADQAAAAKWWLSMPMASVSAEGPMPKALSTRRTSPLMPGCRHQGRACPLRRARMTSNPLIVA